MTTLMIGLPETGEQATEQTMFGGMPSAPAGQLDWPTCTCCSGNMQFQGQLRNEADSTLLLVFMCQNDPGACEEWDANEGGNQPGEQETPRQAPTWSGDISRTVSAPASDSGDILVLRGSRKTDTRPSTFDSAASVRSIIAASSPRDGQPTTSPGTSRSAAIEVSLWKCPPKPFW